MKKQRSFAERLTLDREHGMLRDGEIRYLMLRPDALMGMFKHLPQELRARAFEALADSVAEHGGKSARAYRDSGAMQHDALLTTISETAAALGWGVWSFPTRSEKSLHLVVRNSPFAAGHGTSSSPVCAPIAGMFRAVGKIVFERNVVAHEHECCSCGAAQCSFVASVSNTH